MRLRYGMTDFFEQHLDVFFSVMLTKKADLVGCGYNRPGIKPHGDTMIGLGLFHSPPGCPSHRESCLLSKWSTKRTPFHESATPIL
jgi:hypothetical protein